VALPVTDNLKQRLKNSEIQPTTVAKIDGYATLLTNVLIKEYIRVGDPDLYVGNDWQIGGFSVLADQKSYLSLDAGTTTRISQKIDPSRGAGTSVSTMTLAILDFNAQITELVSPDQILTDMLGRRITIFFGEKESAWPEDYNVVFRGIVQSVKAGPNVVYLNLSNTEEKKRISALSRKTSELSANVNYKSVTYQDNLFKNKEDVQNLITITYIGGGTSGSEIVTVGGFTITVQIQNGVSSAGNIKKKIENNPDANQLVTVKTINSSTLQTIGSTTLGSDTVASVLDASNFITPADVLETFISCEDELIKYTGIAGNDFTGISRGENNSVSAFHETEKTVDQVVKITDNGINVALKLMLSQGPTYYAENLAAKSIQNYSPSIIIDNAIFFNGIDLVTDYGVAEGDLVTVTGATFGANNVTDSIVQEVGLIDNGSYLVVSDNLTNEPSTSAVVKIKSQYNTLPIGFGMLPNEVDIAQHHYIRDTYLPTFNLPIYTKEITDGKSFLEQHVYRAMTCFSVSRKGRSSVAYTVGPLPTYEVVTLDTSTVENPEKLSVERSLNENFFNQVQYDYDYDPVTGKYLTRKNYPESVDKTQIDVNAKPFLIQSQGIRTTEDGATISSRGADRLLRRYQKAAEFIKGINVNYSVGYQLENADVVVVDYSSLKLADYESGTREGPLKLMEIQNKTTDNKTGEVLIDVVNTTFGVGDRYGLISPSSKVGTGSTTSKVILQKSWSTKAFQKESKKWTGYLDQKIIIHDENWTVVYETYLRGFDSNDPQGMSIDPIAVAPSFDWIIQCPDYPSSTDQKELAFWKQRHAFLSPRVAVVAGVSNVRFTVSALDVVKFFIGSAVRVHNYAFTVDSPDRVVTEIIGNDIVVNKTLGFIPSSSEVVDLIGFPDKQQAYRVV